ncbi:GNAT family N-acetyltransferase [Helicobacter pametensis]|uniref:GNAT family N-acetyltransferase n=1 Tax=Helicobacter pametensis TaxID=95149 RepID=UPI000487DD83|nr:GNAT family N-acetyltransferase [Helicobacter pametensis]
MELDIFIEGETIDLCIPTLEFAERSDWYTWFNHPHTTMFLEHGVFPNTKEKQIDFFKRECNERLILMIQDKKQEVIGTATISHINYQKSYGGLGIVFKTIFRENPLEALEAVARITEHAFIKMGLKRIEAAQHIKLIPWSHRMSLVGYRLEGILKNAFVKGIEVVDVIRIAAHYEDYQKIIAHRGGQLWDSQKQMLERLKKLPKKPIHKELQDFFKEHEHYYEEIFQS